MKPKKKEFFKTTFKDKTTKKMSFNKETLKELICDTMVFMIASTDEKPMHQIKDWKRNDISNYFFDEWLKTLDNYNQVNEEEQVMKVKNYYRKVYQIFRVEHYAHRNYPSAPDGESVEMLPVWKSAYDGLPYSFKEYEDAEKFLMNIEIDENKITNYVILPIFTNLKNKEIE